MKTRNIVVASVVLAAALAASSLWVDQRFREWDRRVRAVQVFADQETARADSALLVAIGAEGRADSLITEIRSRAPLIRERIIRVREEPVPEDCEAFVIPRDSVINELLLETEHWRMVFNQSSLAVQALRTAYVALEVANDSLMAVLDDRPRPRPAWMPSLEAGVFAGVCTTGQPCVGAGLGLTWKVKIPL